MNARQKTFAEYFAASGNATEAAKKAGYSDKTARSQGQRLLTKADIKQYITSLQSEIRSSRIVTMEQVKEFWLDIMNNPDEDIKNRLKASELLAKAGGLFFASISKNQCLSLERLYFICLKKMILVSRLTVLD